MTNLESQDDSSIRLQILINRLGINRLKFAKAIGVSQSFVSLMTKGKSKISRSAIDKIGKSFPKVNIHWLLTGDGDVFLPESFQEAVSVVAENDEHLKKYSKNVPINTIVDESELRKTLGKNLNTLNKRWGMKKNELIGVLAPGTKKPTVTNYFNGSSQLPLGALVRLEELTGIGLSAWVTREIREIEMPFEPISSKSVGGIQQIEMVKESLRNLLNRL